MAVGQSAVGPGTRRRLPTPAVKTPPVDIHVSSDASFHTAFFVLAYPSYVSAALPSSRILIPCQKIYLFLSSKWEMAKLKNFIGDTELNYVLIFIKIILTHFSLWLTRILEFFQSLFNVPEVINLHFYINLLCLLRLDKQICL